MENNKALLKEIRKIIRQEIQNSKNLYLLETFPLDMVQQIQNNIQRTDFIKLNKLIKQQDQTVSTLQDPEDIVDETEINKWLDKQEDIMSVEDLIDAQEELIYIATNMNQSELIKMTQSILNILNKI